jgi:hypothetical protein
MRSLRFVVVFGMCVLGLSLVAIAEQNKFGIADTYKIAFAAPTRVGPVLLPQGTYQVLHTMDGQDHIMVFKQLSTKKPAEARAKCQIVPLPKKAARDEQEFVINASNERVLRTLVFKGDSAQHVF